MIHELRKLLQTRWAVILLAAGVLANGFIFYRHCTDSRRGFTLQEIRTAYETWNSPQEMERAVRALEQRIWGEDSTQDVGELSPDDLREYRILREAYGRICQSRDYRNTLEGFLEETRMKLDSGIFGSGGPSTERILQRNLDVYTRLRGLHVPVAFSGGVEVLADFHITDVILLMFAVLPTLVLVTGERSEGLMLLLHPMKQGHLTLWRWKLEAVTATVTAGFLVLVGTDVAISSALLGLGDLSRPIQAVYGFELCPRPYTVLGFLLLLNGLRLLWALACSGFFFALACAFSRPLVLGLCAGGTVALAFVFQVSDSLWLRALSLTAMLFRETCFQGNLLVSLGGALISCRAVSSGLCLVLCAGSAAAGAVLFCSRSPVPVRKLRQAMGRSARPGKTGTSLLGHEGYKLYVMNAAAAVLALFLVLQIVDCRNCYINRGEWEHYYASWSAILEGPPGPEKEEFLERTQQQFAQLSQTSPNDTQADIRLRAQPAFETARFQYDNLREGQWYLYRSPYRELFGPDGQMADLSNTVRLAFALVLGLCGVFAVERQTGVEILQTAAGQRSRAARAKMVHCAGFSLLAAVIAYVPRFVTLWSGYGPLLLQAPAISVDAFAGLPGGWTIGMVLVLIAAFRLLLTAACAAGILFISSRSRSIVTSAGISLCLVCLPFFAALLLLSHMG